MGIQEGLYTCAKDSSIKVYVTQVEAEALNNGKTNSALNTQVRGARDICNLRDNANCIRYCDLLNLSRDISYSQNPPDNP